MRNVLKLNASRDAYGLRDVMDRTMTVGELINMLSDFDEDTLVVMSHDHGYTYGYLNDYRFELEEDVPETDEEAKEMDELEDEDW